MAPPARVAFAAWGLLLAGLAIVTTSATAALLLGTEGSQLPRDAVLREGFAAGASLTVGLGILAALVGGSLIAEPTRMRPLARFACAVGAAVCGLAAVAFLAGGPAARLEPGLALHALAGVVAAGVAAIALGLLTRALRPFRHVAPSPSL